MKNQIIKKRLQQELKTRCYQIGIPATQEPKLCWNVEQFKWYVGEKQNRKNVLGRTAFVPNTILINLKNHKNYKFNFIEYRDTLIHELVHIRFQNQKHGIHFRQLIERIKKGEIFPIRTVKDIRFPNETNINPINPK